MKDTKFLILKILVLVIYRKQKEFEFQSEVELKTGLCCPITFTKFHFQWNGEKFAIEGKPELFDYDWEKRIDK